MRDSSLVLCFRPIVLNGVVGVNIADYGLNLNNNRETLDP